VLRQGFELIDIIEIIQFLYINTVYFYLLYKSFQTISSIRNDTATKTYIFIPGKLLRFIHNLLT